jgi:hypothetical protein
MRRQLLFAFAHGNHSPSCYSSLRALAKQSSLPSERPWIASSLALLAMTHEFSFSRCGCIRVLPSRCKKAFPKSSSAHDPEKWTCGFRNKIVRRIEGGGAPRGASNLGRIAADKFTLSARTIRGCGSGLIGGRSPFGAPPRLSPEAQRPTGSAPGHASWDADRAGVTRLHLSQSRDCTPAPAVVPA